MDQAQPTPLYCNAFRSLKKRAENGHELTINEIEEAVDADPATRKAFAEMAEEVRHGRDFTVEEFARRARIPADFAVFLIVAFVGHFAIGLRQETVN